MSQKVTFLVVYEPIFFTNLVIMLEGPHNFPKIENFSHLYLKQETEMFLVHQYQLIKIEVTLKIYQENLFARILWHA